MRNNAKISKRSPDVSAAMNKYASVITVLHQHKNHWITLRFKPKEKILEVFDSMQLGKFSSLEKKLKSVGPPPYPSVKHCLSFMNRNF
jgi:hypothetical protein